MSYNRQEAVQICRVYTPPKVKDGTWILVDRLWPRGLKKETLDFDLWLKEITPDAVLRQWFHENPKDRWNEFKNQYIDYLKNKAALIEEIQDMAKHAPVILFYAAKDTKRNHASILQEVIRFWPSLPHCVAP